MSPRRVLVTGAAGLVGVHTCSALLRQPERFVVRAMVRAPQKLTEAMRPHGVDASHLEIATGDVTDAESVAAAMTDCDALIHAAGLHARADPETIPRMQTTNVTGTRTVISCAVAAHLDPIVHVSSYLAQFPPKGKIQYADDPITEPGSHYARTKAEAERIARDFQAQGAPVVILYPGAIQGPLDPTFGATPGFIADSIRKREWFVTSGGRSYIDVRDLAEVIRATLEPGLGPRRFMCGGPYVMDADVLVLLKEITGLEIRARRIPDPILRFIGRLGDLYRMLTRKEPTIDYEGTLVLTRSVPCDDEAAKALIGRPFRDFGESMRELLVWMVQAGHLTAEDAGPLLAAAALQQSGASSARRNSPAEG